MSTTTLNEPITLFVYGTLQRGRHNHRVLEEGGAVYLGRAVLKDVELWDLGAFPAVTVGRERVAGELYQLDRAALQAVDMLEGAPRFYQRIERTVRAPGGLVRAWVYVMERDQVLAMQGVRVKGVRW